MKILISVPVMASQTFEIEANSQEEAIAEFCKNGSTLVPLAIITPEQAKIAVKCLVSHPRKVWDVKHFPVKK
jgi:hypothetical protein